MKHPMLAALAALSLVATAPSAPAHDSLVVMRNAALPFATLPAHVRYPEGIAANPATGDVYVGTFDFSGNNKLMRFSRNGRLAAMRDFGGTPLLGLDFDASQGKVWILNMGASKVQRIAAAFDANTPVEDVASVPSIGAPGNRSVVNPDTTNDTIIFGSNGFAAPNAMVFDAAGNLYFSDSFQGAIFKIANARTCATPCSVTTFAHDPLLATAGFPPFGANGLAISPDGSTMYIANTGDSRVLKMDMATAAVSVFVESIAGADGLVMDADGRLWVCSNQGDQVVALDERGRIVAKMGDFFGVDNRGAPIGLLFPASPVIVDGWMYVTNLALPLRGTPDEPETDVTVWNVARIKLPRR